MRIKILLLICYLLPFLIISIYNQPAIDDFWNANTVIAHGRLGTVIFYFQTVSGRFFSNFLMSFLNTLPYGSIWIFKLWPVVIIVLLFGSILFLFRSIFSENISFKQAVIASLLFVLLHLANIRVLFEGLYWMSSTICYQVAICLFAVGTGAVVRCISTKSFAYSVIAVMSSLLLPGAAETLAPVYIFVLAVILFVSIKLKRPLTITIISLAAVFLSFLVIFLSKGNHVRITNKSFIAYPGTFYAFYYAARAVGYYFLYWITTLVNVSALILALPFIHRFANQNSKKLQTLNLHPILLLIILFFLCCIIYLPQLLFEAQTPSPRITTLVFFLASHFAILILCITLLRYPRFNQFVAHYSNFKNYHLITCTFFFVCAFTSTNFSLVVKDLANGSAKGFNKEALCRYAKIKSTKSDTCYVDRYTNWPAFIQSSKKEDYSFTHMNIFFGKTILYKNPWHPFVNKLVK